MLHVHVLLVHMYDMLAINCVLMYHSNKDKILLLLSQTYNISYIIIKSLTSTFTTIVDIIFNYDTCIAVD